mgnify:CR=1 FL=1|tara:strand:- start:158 stop:664 length:507 start_codon:yes stop_codon:yes gene_type:complete
MTTELWQNAAAFAANAHRHQTRNDGRPFVSHCFRVAMTIHLVFGFDEPEILAAALLHDTIEDCDVDYDDILQDFGTTVADYVAAMTKDMRLEEKNREVEYDKQLARGPWQVRLIKLADVYDNFTDSSPSMRTNQMEKINRILSLTKNDKELLESRDRLFDLQKEMQKC